MFLLVSMINVYSMKSIESIVYIGLSSPFKKTSPIFFAKSHLKTVQALPPFFSKSPPPIYWFFRNSPTLKIKIFSKPHNQLKMKTCETLKNNHQCLLSVYSCICPSQYLFLQSLCCHLGQVFQFKFLVKIENNISVNKLCH